MIENADPSPPGSVRDLFVKLDVDQKLINVSFTASGDDMDTGKASRYDLKYDTDVQKLRSDFEGVLTGINESDLVDGTLEPVESGTRVQISLKMETIQNSNLVNYLAMKSQDEVNKTSDISNIVQLYLNIPREVDLEPKEASDVGYLTAGEIVGIVLGCMFGVFIIAAFLFFVKYKIQKCIKFQQSAKTKDFHRRKTLLQLYNI